jgi:Ca-activated chloride channel family protein
MTLLAIEYREGTRLWLLLAVAALAGAYVFMQFQRRRDAVRFANAELLASVAPRRPGWRRHLTASLLLLSLIAMVVAFARPVRAEDVATEQGTIMLAIDVSLSMQATDVSPDRLEAAQEAATQFVDGLPEGIRLGLVRFARGAEVVVPPTDDKDKLKRAINGLDLLPGTAIGEAIFASLDALETAGVIDDAGANGTGGNGNGGNGNDGSEAPRGGADDPNTTPSTSNPDEPIARIVVMSDGKTNSGRPDAEGAQAAADAGVPVSTIAFGTPEGEVMNPETGRMEAVPVDAEALAAIAEATGGTAYAADSLASLEEVYQDIGATVTTERQIRELASWFAGFGLLFGGLAAVGALVWTGRLP